MRGTVRYQRKYNAEIGASEEIPCYSIDGRVVTEAEYKAAFPDKPIGTFGAECDWRKPVESDGLAVHPKRIKQAEAMCAKNGVSVDFTTLRGRPILKNRAQRRQVLKIFGFHDNNSFGNG